MLNLAQFSFRENRELELLLHLACNEIIKDYNTKAVNVDALSPGKEWQ